MDREGLLQAVRAIGLALNVTHNTVTTDVVGVEPGDTAWRIDHTGELKLIDSIISAVNGDTCFVCGGRNRLL